MDLPREKVAESFDNPENRKRWQPEQQEFTHFGGEPGHPGAPSRLQYEMNARAIIMIEPIKDRFLPDRFKKTDGRLYRSIQFAIVKPGMKTRVDLGIKARNLIQAKRLEDAGSSPSVLTQKISLNTEDEVDAQLIGWMKQA